MLGFSQSPVRKTGRNYHIEASAHCGVTQQSKAKQAKQAKQANAPGVRPGQTKKGTYSEPLTQRLEVTILNQLSCLFHEARCLVGQLLILTCRLLI